MSDKFPRGEPSPDKDTPEKHGIARHLVEAADAARAEGDDERAEQLIAEAGRTDPEGAADALADAASSAPFEPQDDEEIERMGRTIEPRSDAPSRSGITGAGSGADDM